MGRCRFCLTEAGWFRSEHASCVAADAERQRLEAERAAEAAIAAREAEAAARAAVAGWQRDLSAAFLAVCNGSGSLEEADLAFNNARQAAGVDTDTLRSMAVRAWEEAAAWCTRFDVLEEEHDRALARLQVKAGLSRQDADIRGALTKLVKVKISSQLAAGKMPTAITLEESFPVILQKGETPIWCFKPATLYEDRTGRISPPGQAGVYARERIAIDAGLLLLSSRCIYFLGHAKSVQVPLSKVATVLQLQDGISVGRSSATAKPLIFQVDEAAFAFKLVGAATRLEREA